ncbi:MAG TPA: hypothetical protein VF857_05145 [Spirochaetota bacterium]
MLTFFATLLVNILVGTVFYLIISLKLEKSASELHVKKIRREMDEMIREFNLTAERNISLLENRIDIMKRLLEKNGIPVEFEVRADERHELSHAKGEHTGAVMTRTVRGDIASDEKRGFLGRIGEQLREAIGDVRTIREDAASKSTAPGKGGKKKSTESALQKSDVIQSERARRNASIVRGDEILRQKFAAAPDRAKRYELIHELFDDGYSADEISRLSGVPAGEISLIASLSRS